MFKNIFGRKEKPFSETDARVLLALIWSLKPSDLSVLMAYLPSLPDSEIGTTQGSCNNLFWSWLEGKGLAKCVLPKEGDSGKPLKTKSFQLTESGRQIISSNMRNALNAGSPPSASVISSECVAILQQYADEKNKEALTKLAILYTEGNGVAKDIEKAFQFYFISAEQGDPVAANNLGIAYFIGEGVSKNVEEAQRWFRKAASMGSAGAMDNLGEMYGKGIGVAQDLNEALKWFQSAGDFGHAVAQCRVGDFYYKGIGVEPDYLQAYIWYKLGLQSGIDVSAKYQAAKSELTDEQIAEGDRVVGQWKPKQVQSP